MCVLRVWPPDSARLWVQEFRVPPSPQSLPAPVRLRRGEGGEVGSGGQRAGGRRAGEPPPASFSTPSAAAQEEEEDPEEPARAHSRLGGGSPPQPSHGHQGEEEKAPPPPCFQQRPALCRPSHIRSTLALGGWRGGGGRRGGVGFPRHRPPRAYGGVFCSWRGGGSWAFWRDPRCPPAPVSFLRGVHWRMREGVSRRGGGGVEGRSCPAEKQRRVLVSDGFCALAFSSYGQPTRRRL